MKVYFLPKTALGKWSIGGIVGSIAFWLAFRFTWEVGIPGAILIGLSSLSAFFTGIIGIIKRKDRSVIVFITTIVGLIIFLTVLAFVIPL